MWPSKWAMWNGERVYTSPATNAANVPGSRNVPGTSDVPGTLRLPGTSRWPITHRASRNIPYPPSTQLKNTTALYAAISPPVS